MAVIWAIWEYAHGRIWTDKPANSQRVVYNNRHRTRRAKSKRLQRKRSERVERSFAHICETGGARRTWLCGFDKVRKRYLMSAMARNLGLLMRAWFGLGTARSLQGEGKESGEAGGVAAFIYRAWPAMLNVPGELLTRRLPLKRAYAQNPSFARRLSNHQKRQIQRAVSLLGSF